MISSSRKYRKNYCITFRSTKGQYGSLSNMSPYYPVKIGDVSVNTIEALYQSLKFPNYPNIQHKIIQFRSPIEAKKYSRINDDKVRSDWEYNKFKIMRFCLQLKLKQNLSTFSEVLLSTGNSDIVEFTYNDIIWGAIDAGNYYEGTNALGRLLMELREDLKKNQAKIVIPKVGNFMFLGKIITEDLLAFD